MANRYTATAAVRQGIESDTQHGAVVPPLYLSTNYSFSDHLSPRAFDYSRSGNPTRCLLAEALTELEHGAGAVVTATGMAAITLVTSLLTPEQLLIIPHDCYGGSYRLFTHLAAKGHFQLKVIDQTDAAAIDAALTLQPAMFWLETPSNPLLRIVDIAAIAHKLKETDSLLVVDNTFLSPVLQQPLLLGADIVVHSTTKYINGHSDVVGGAVIAKDAAIADKLNWWSNTLGLTGGAFDSYLTLRGLRTLSVRMRQHQENCQAVVALLQQSTAVSQIHFPGLSSHPGHSIAVRQQQGFGAMVSFELKGGQAQLTRFLSELKFFSLAESLGGVESLVAIPATMTHRAMDPEARRLAGISDNLIRLSIGIEDPRDLVADLSHALAVASGLEE
ncbi:cystathionine gamma-synthase [Shewanella sp. SNU WT4]|uniref:cystathionine gamma-synthase n=1 Tax=Shewanella sp. SNU WT4 TaxID=2590015 RepID=UPI001125F457|nr:cystathionine gamma-synthase [Shewanella sp. SNU WT4]QDF68272.1 cystathionine gamma-synthase [Shewanella sp. SNU WT4]